VNDKRRRRKPDGVIVRNRGARVPAKLSIFVLLLVAATLSPASAYAYVDPGTGSLVLQGLIAAVLGVGLTLKLSWRKIRKLLTGRSSRDDESDADR
jgi:hypothetical protein